MAKTKRTVCLAAPPAEHLLPVLGQPIQVNLGFVWEFALLLQLYWWTLCRFMGLLFTCQLV